jgi:hypothetical protein
MRTVILFLFTCVISTGALLAGLNMKHPMPCYVVALTVWLLLGRYVSRQSKKNAHKRMMERMFTDHMRTTYKNRQR